MAEDLPVARWFRRLLSRDRRNSARHHVAGLVAFYWDGGPPVGRPVREISLAGMYLLTEQRWYVGTVVTMTLQKSTEDGELEFSMAIQAKVVRHGADGVGLAFAFPEVGNSRRKPRLEATTSGKSTLDGFLRRFPGAMGRFTQETDMIAVRPTCLSKQAGSKSHECFSPQKIRNDGTRRFGLRLMKCPGRTV